MQNKKPIRLIASDLDGTLFHGAKDHNSISRENQEAVRRWQTLGNHFIIATGRPSGIRTMISNEYALDCDIIACNGAKVIVSSKLWWSHEISPELLLELCEICDEYHNEIDFALDMDSDVRVAYKSDGIIRSRFTKADESLITAREYLSQSQSSYPNKVFLVLDHPERREFFMDLFRRRFQNRLSITSSGIAFIEMGCPGISKGHALAEIMKTMNLEPEQAAAIGDEQNDLDMLKSVPMGFVMSSARQEIRDQIDRKIDSVADLIDWCIRHNEALENKRV